MYSNLESNQTSGTFTSIALWILIGLVTLLSLGCTWGYFKHYDDSDRVLSAVAGTLTTVAMCGCAIGLCNCGGVESATNKQVLSGCYDAIHCDKGFAYYFKCLANCSLNLIIVPSFGILQLISGSIMIQSLLQNSATNVRVLAGFVVAFDYLAALCGLVLLCVFCRCAIKNCML